MEITGLQGGFWIYWVCGFWMMFYIGWLLEVFELYVAWWYFEHLRIGHRGANRSGN